MLREVCDGVRFWALGRNRFASTARCVFNLFVLVKQMSMRNKLVLEDLQRKYRVYGSAQFLLVYSNILSLKPLQFFTEPLHIDSWYNVIKNDPNHVTKFLAPG